SLPTPSPSNSSLGSKRSVVGGEHEQDPAARPSAASAAIPNRLIFLDIMASIRPDNMPGAIVWMSDDPMIDHLRRKVDRHPTGAPCSSKNSQAGPAVRDRPPWPQGGGMHPIL